MWQSLVSALMQHQLRASFRRVCWVGDRPDLPSDQPVVIYANHHHALDGHLLWLIIDRMLERPGTTWMARWDRFPFFAAMGAQPFPADDPARPEDGILDLSPAAFAKLHRIFPDPWWWPVALHVTWWGEMKPTALLAGGTPSPEPPSDPKQELTQLWTPLRHRAPDTHHTLLDGRRSPSEVWDFSMARSLFERYL